MIRILIVLCLLLAPAAVSAEDAAPAPSASANADTPTVPAPAPPADAQAEQKSVQAWGRDNPDCAEWSDACVACTKEGCSTPGIACVSQDIVCRRK
ncbi:MAG TPA: hypothetical protein PKA55_20625 [Rhodoblastus sp.]|nr:hypothetical protein [Rhodoblastus sp.]